METNEPLVIQIEADSKFARQIEAAGHRPVVIEVNGVRFQIHREYPRLAISKHPGEFHNPSKALAGMRAAAGAWDDLDAEEMKQMVYQGRLDGSRSIEGT